MKITFEIRCYQVIVSSHGVFTVVAKNLPSLAHSSAQHNVIFKASTDVLNETWEAEGKEPQRLEGHDDGMPDVDDPRLERCVRKYVEVHRNELDALYADVAVNRKDVL